ncbi:MAG: 4-(cytidine 5'-diphospho)-2-C-methyl-D-erythritol kinase [Bacteroidales bacterium]|nr:4-(cytidine 5'-diphospho)-2-C-methyl-D-erythritol kinase [Bacteroidales bacterium]
MKTRPNCKINLGLHVVGRRADGYHDIETIFLPVFSLCDELEITPAPASQGQPTMVQQGIELDNAPDQNLCVRAWQLLHDEFDIPPVNILLTKHIPFGAGLGGGSADAAFTLRMLNEMFSLGLDQAQLELRAAQLGADCPFFVANRAAYATGIGDRLEPIDIDLSRYDICIEMPEGETVSTREAYANLAVDFGQPRPDLRQAVKQPIVEWKKLIVNDFEKSVFPLHPAISRLKTRLYERGARYVSMTGSGAALFAIYDKFMR